MQDYLKTELSASDLTLYDEPLRPTTGIQSQLPVLYEEYRFRQPADVEDYLALLALTGDYFDQIIRFEQQKAQAGLFMSDYACNTLISQCNAFTADPDQHYLIQTFDHKIDAMSELTENQKTLYKEKCRSGAGTCASRLHHLAAALTELLGSGKTIWGSVTLQTERLLPLPGLPQHRERFRSSGAAGPDLRKRQSDLQQAAALLSENPQLKASQTTVRLPAADPIATLNGLQEAMRANFPAPPETTFTVSSIDECMEDYMAPAFYITSPIDDYAQNFILSMPPPTPPPCGISQRWRTRASPATFIRRRCPMKPDCIPCGFC